MSESTGETGFCNMFENFQNKKLKEELGASLAAQWISFHLPMQGTQVRSLVQEIPHATEQLSLCSTTTEPAL